MRDRPLSAEALDIMARATVAQMRGDAAELAARSASTQLGQFETFAKHMPSVVTEL